MAGRTWRELHLFEGHADITAEIFAPVSGSDIAFACGIVGDLGRESLSVKSEHIEFAGSAYTEFKAEFFCTGDCISEEMSAVAFKRLAGICAGDRAEHSHYSAVLRAPGEK